ncbi:MAG TPA: hypothetical protein VGH33_06570 [Isosphaeraceae bacterium]|jgi:hypothetical protein
MTDGRDDEIVFLTGCRDHPSVPVPPPAGSPRRSRSIILFAAPARRHRTRRRKLYLADMAVMLVVLALASLVMTGLAARMLPAGGRAGRPGDYAACMVPLGIAAAGMLFGYRILGPRNPGRSPLREPGFVAGLMLALTACLSLIFYVVNGILYDIHMDYYCPNAGKPRGCTHPGWVAPDPDYLEGVFFRDVAMYCGLAVIVGWIMLAAMGRGGPRRDWIDLAGIALGLGWVGASVASFI